KALRRFSKPRKTFWKVGDLNFGFSIFRISGFLLLRISFFLWIPDFTVLLIRRIHQMLILFLLMVISNVPHCDSLSKAPLTIANSMLFLDHVCCPRSSKSYDDR